MKNSLFRGDRSEVHPGQSPQTQNFTKTDVQPLGLHRRNHVTSIQTRERRFDE